ncbi:NAD-dependent epimerase/dehydratase family protein [Mesorhizobium sp. WSM4307]|uniref:NAD(P)H-binding protein n=1 Tax=unclassified Mesorhizobium TaxID=325217 RepID=UPI00115D471A|nr:MULTISPECIES: NAD(P)H-binding protein [unclassified Mesorhizobium]TRC77270.1 NAD-dependent epimerase/dehydratase family protein [Mesorhizobium sp. WSM4315]TRC86694.1 NAD-dependent epimerase/dehydratase family protein [Mesorhizobium sp. WSM4307]
MILVTGATGHIGRAVVSRLVSSGHEVAALVRKLEAGQGRLPRETALRVGDYEDASTLKAAFTGIDRLVLISSDGAADAVTRHHANAIAAATAAGVRHITFTSIVDIGETSPFYYAPAYRDAERRLAASGVPSTILRCGLYSDFILDTWLAPASGQLVLPAGQGLVAPVSRDNVAAAVAAVATGAHTSRAVYTITGGRALGFNEIAACYGEATAWPLRYHPCSLSEYLASASARLDEPWPRAFTTLCASIAEGRYGGVSRDFAILTDRQPESFRDFLARAMSAMPAEG